MQNVPQFALKRLKEMPPAAGSHPDADMLTAFAEQSLAGDERARVMEHLAACGDCRDVIALALPATEIVAMPASANAARIGWLSWPALRWGALAAGILAVTSVGVLHYSHRNQQETVASNRMQAAVAAPSAMNQAPSSQAIIPQPEIRKKALAVPSSPILTAPKLDLKARRADQPPNFASYGGAIHGSVVAGNGSGSGGGIGAGAGGGVSANRGAAFAQASPGSPAAADQVQNSAPEIHQQVKVGAMSEVVEVEAGSGTINTESAAISQNQVAQNQSNLPQQGRAFTDLDVVKAKNPVPGQAASAAAPAPQLASPGPLQTAPALMLRASPRWTVSSSGVLQRSFDGGNTWENVNPALNAELIGGPMAKESTAKDTARFSQANQDQTNQDQAKQNRKVTAAPNPAPVFRAVAAAGPEVWAGGSGGALYHTSDGGNRWTRVAPSTAATVLTGDVIGIQFTDTQHGKISTSTAELWTTSDAGQTWRRQQ
jgi:hypothetical protein